MHALDFFLMILGGIGLSHILADSSIASSLKYKLLYREDATKNIQKRFKGKMEFYVDKFVELLNCHQCNGWWAGGFVFVLYYYNITILLWAFAISLLSPLWAAFYVYVVSLTNYEDAEDEQENYEEDEDEK